MTSTRGMTGDLDDLVEVGVEEVGDHVEGREEPSLVRGPQQVPDAQHLGAGGIRGSNKE